MADALIVEPDRHLRVAIAVEAMIGRHPKARQALLARRSTLDPSESALAAFVEIMAHTLADQRLPVAAIERACHRLGGVPRIYLPSIAEVIEAARREA